jgi:error-prone DNA polymerase
MDYTELHCLSSFSFLRGASAPDELTATAIARGYRGLALTDECSFAGVVRAWDEAKAHPGFRFIVGAEMHLTGDSHGPGTCRSGGRSAFRPTSTVKCRAEARPKVRPATPITPGPRLILLVENLTGYQTLSQLITRARRDTPKGQYRLAAEDLPALPGLQVLWAPGRDLNADTAAWLRDRFSHVSLALARHREADDRTRFAEARQLARRFGISPVAVGEVHYHGRERGPLQDVVTALRLGKPVAACGRALFPNHERHLRLLAELEALYPKAWLRETQVIAERCDFRLDTLRYQYPAELVDPGETPTSQLRALTETGLRWRWPGGVPDKVRALVARELALIAEMAYESFFLTVADIVSEARRRGILCQGRGSAANSVVCYALGITEVSPDFTELLFERFVSKERGEPPDIDVDFEHQRREDIIQYIYGKYGRHRAALAATVIHWRPRSALRDVGKALEMPPEVIDQLARNHAWWDAPERWAMHLDALGVSPADPRVQQWLNLSRELIGLPRHLSQHVGGFIIAEHDVADLVPVENAAMPDRSIIQWNKDDLESLGLLKVDVLALGMLTAIRKTVDALNQWAGRVESRLTAAGIDQPVGRPSGRHPNPPASLCRVETRPTDKAGWTLADIPRDCPATFAMLQRGESLGVFQVESRAQMNMLPRLKPKTLYDLAIQVAIVRPGPIQGGMVHPFLKARQGREVPDLPDNPELRAVLNRTSGVPIFQEQVMQIAVVAAGFSPGEADQVRRSMAAWKRKGGLEHFRDRLMAGMAERGYDPAFAERIYQQILGFGAYGFPESHAASFALLTWFSSWLKCHHPAAFFCGLINSLPMGFYPVSMLVGEARRMGVTVLPVDVRHSDVPCVLAPDERGQPAIRLGLGLIKGLGAPAAARVVAARRTTLTDVPTLAQRARLDRKALEALARSDALRGLAGHRHAARWAAMERHTGQADLFESPPPETVTPELVEPREGADIVADYQSTGLSLRRHPVALLRTRLARARVQPNVRLKELPDGQRVRVAGLAMFRQRPGSAKGVMFLTLEDETGVVNLIIRSALIDTQRQAVVSAQFVIAEGVLQNQEGIVHLMAERLHDRSHWVGELPYLSRDFH